jgi:hypothetical protein
MLHPATELRTIDAHISYGIFATAEMPMGTIIYAKDAMEIIVNEEDMLYLDRKYREHIEKYSYTEENGSKVLAALARFTHVAQPLLDYLSPETYCLLENYLNNHANYRSVRELERRVVQHDVA